MVNGSQPIAAAIGRERTRKRPCQTPCDEGKGRSFVRLMPRSRSPSRAAPLRPLTLRFIGAKSVAVEAAFPDGRLRLPSVLKGQGMGAGTGSAMLSVPAITLAAASIPASRAGLRPYPQPRRAASRCRPTLRRHDAGGRLPPPSAASRRPARPLFEGRPGARRSESCTCPTRCSSTPRIPRRPALS